MKNHFSICRLLKIVHRGFCVLISETSCSSDFKKPLGLGTTFRELKVLAKMATGLVNHSTGVGDHFPGASGAVKVSILFVNRNLACGLSYLDCPGRGVSKGAYFFLRNLGLALCSGRILV